MVKVTKENLGQYLMQKIEEGIKMEKKYPQPPLTEEEYRAEYIEDFKDFYGYEPERVPLRRKRQNSYEIIFGTMTTQFEYYVKFRTEKEGEFCPHPCYKTQVSEEELRKSPISYFIGKPFDQVNEHIHENNNVVRYDIFKENNRKCYLYQFAKKKDSSSLFQQYTFEDSVIFITSYNDAIDHYTLFNVEEYFLFHDHRIKLFYQDSNHETSELMARGDRKKELNNNYL